MDAIINIILTAELRKLNPRKNEWLVHIYKAITLLNRARI